MIKQVFVPSDGGLASQLFWLGRGLDASQRGLAALVFGHNTSRGQRPFALHRLAPSANFSNLPNLLRPNFVSRAAKIAGFRVLDVFDPQRLGVEHVIEFMRSPEASSEARRIFHGQVTQEQIAIHFRAGDYRKNPHTRSIHGHLSPEWYLAAAEQIRNSTVDSVRQITIFSDEPDYAVFSLLEPFEDAGFKVDFSRGQSLEGEMSECVASRHFIGSNSGISFWIAAAREVTANSAQSNATLLPKEWFLSVNREVAKWMILGQFAPLRYLTKAEFMPSTFSPV